MARRSSPEISAGSMADIAFLLLIFFLVTTTMEKEAGIMRILPEMQDQVKEEVNERNVINILVNDNNQILFKKELIDLSQLTSRIEEMIVNVDNRADWPQNFELNLEILEGLVEKAQEDINKANESTKSLKEKAYENAKMRLEAYELFGSDFKKSAHVISIQSTRGAEYNTYIELSDHVLMAYKNLKVKLAKKKLNKAWRDLSDREKDLLNLVYPQNISEAQTVQGAN